MERHTPRTIGKRNCLILSPCLILSIQTKSHKEAYTYTLTKRDKGKQYIYHCSQSSQPQFWDASSSNQVFHRCTSS